MLVTELDTMLTSSKTDNITLRNAAGITYTAMLSKIKLVTDNRVCAKVLDGANAALHTPGRARQIYVVSTGGGYAALDPDPAAGGGEHTPVLFLTTKFVVTGVVAIF